MSVINTQIKPFKNMAFKEGKFIEITDEAVKGKWSVFVFYPADFTFVCPTELGDVADHYAEFQNCLLYTSPSPRDKRQSRMPSSA